METQICEVRYLGNAKKQPNFDERVAFGHDGQDWAYVFPESVLQSFFSGVTLDPTQATTLYGVLGISRGATQEEIRQAFRATAKSWHSDVNRLYEDQAKNASFIRVKDAYDLLSNPEKRARYDTGLALEASLKRPHRSSRMLPLKQDQGQDYRPAKRCGYVLCEGAQNNRGQFVVSQILDWQDITQGDKTLVSSWQPGARTYTESWLKTPQPARS